MGARSNNGRVTWITGSSAGLGAALAQELVHRGDHVVISARSTEKLEALAAELNKVGICEALQLDVTDRRGNQEAVDAIIRRFGRLDRVVFNAGTYYAKKGEDIDCETFDKTLEVNFFGVINGLVPVIHQMKKQGKGQIAIVSSAVGYAGLPKSAAYGASKAALINLAESLKFDCDRMNIRLQIVTPGFVDTPLTKKNAFAMPFLMPADKAAKRFADGLEKGGFEITFPRRFTWFVKLVSILPYWLYFPIIKTITREQKPNATKRVRDQNLSST